MLLRLASGLLSEILFCRPNDAKNIIRYNILMININGISIRDIQDKRLQTEIREMTQIASCLTRYGAPSEKVLNTLKTKSVEFLYNNEMRVTITKDKSIIFF